jgi:predicted ferric reductase
MLRSKLFGEKATLAQQLIVGAWYLNLVLVLVLWQRTSWSLFLHGGIGGFFVAIGQLLGLLATVFALTQFLLMGRIWWIERHFGLDHLASYHRLNGYLTITAIVLHPIFIIIGYSFQNHFNIVHQYFQVVFHYSYAWLAVIAQLLFILVVATSIYIVRKRLKFESWYYVHLAVYVAIVSVFFHQFALGESFLGHPLARLYWYLLYAFVTFNVLFWRFSWPTLRSLYFDFRVSKVIPETATTTSVYISVRNFKHWRSLPGQFVLVRIFSRELWLEEHPFSLSMIPHDGQLRLTIRNVGDYTSMIAKLKPGKRILLSGPFGRFTKELAKTDKRLFIAGGVGITPLRSLAEEAMDSNIPSKLIYGNREPDDVVFETELAELSKQGLEITPVFSAAPAGFKGETGYVNGALIKRLVPDYQQRDIYLCGPPPMMEGIIKELVSAGLATDRLHFERFALHN